MTSCHCCAADQEFSSTVAARDLRRFQRRGPDAATCQLVDAVAEARLADAPTLLDVGGGIGAIHHLLLDRGFARATHVDASSAYLAAAAGEARRLGHADRVAFQHADFRSAAAQVTAADVVTLDRVVCCDPDFAGLLGAAADHARRLLAFTYPRRRWPIRAVISASNGWRRLIGRPFRVYSHSPSAMRSVLERRGLRRRWTGGTWVWAAEVFERPAGNLRASS